MPSSPPLEVRGRLLGGAPLGSSPDDALPPPTNWVAPPASLLDALAQDFGHRFPSPAEAGAVETSVAEDGTTRLTQPTAGMSLESAGTLSRALPPHG